MAQSAGIAWTSFARGGEGRPALAIRRGEGWVELTYGALGGAVERVAAELVAGGVANGDRVGILAESGPGWAVGLFGVWQCGAVAVPLDTRLTVEEQAAQLAHARVRVLIASKDQASAARTLADGVASVERVLVLGSDGRAIEEDRALIGGDGQARGRGRRR